MYYDINEQSARAAKECNSFSDYIQGSATASYKSRVDEVIAIAEEAKRRVKEEQHDYIDYLADKFAKKYAEWINKANRIDSYYPSVMICGASNFNVRKKEKQNNMRDNHQAEYNKLQKIVTKIEDIGTGKEIIKSSDALAIDKLQDKVDSLTALQNEMKEYNAYYRKNKSMVGYEELTEEKAKQLDIEIANSWYKVPFATFELTNNNAKIKNTQQRLDTLKKIKAQPTEDKSEKYNSSVCKVVEDTEDMRIRLIFDGKPSEAIRSILKSHGFRWSPANTAWQRQLTNNARYETKQIIKQLEIV